MIRFADDTAFKPECHYRGVVSPKGKMPAVRQSVKRYHSSFINAVNRQGRMQRMPLRKLIYSDIFLKFLRQMIKFRKKNIYMVVDNLRVHHSKPVKQLLEENRHRIVPSRRRHQQLIFLPSYSPELNPDVSTTNGRTLKRSAKQYLNNYLKQTVTKNERPTDKDE